MESIKRLLLVAALLASGIALAGDQPGKFDFYVLALSWSPDYCANNGNPGSQCKSGRKLGFVLHGLWPQHTQGWPSDCSTETMPAAVKARFPNLYPSPALYGHEWQKHGTCSGLEPEGYLALSRQVKDSVVIPDAYRSPAQPFRVTRVQLRDAFIQANPALSDDAIAPNCSGSGRFLQEVQICFSRDGSRPVACSDEVLKKSAKSCRQKDFLVRSVR